MKCPLTVLTGQNNAVGNSRFYGDCLKEECGLWDEAEAQCAFLSLATWLPHIVKLLRGTYELAKK